MARYLLAFTCSPSDYVQYSVRVFKVSKNLSPYDVAFPENTFMFIFVNSDAKNVKELQESFVYTQINTRAVFNSSSSFQIENEGKRYFIGKHCFYMGVEGVYNLETGSFIPVSYLSDIDEIIDI